MFVQMYGLKFCGLFITYEQVGCLSCRKSDEKSEVKCGRNISYALEYFERAHLFLIYDGVVNYNKYILKS